MAAALSHDEEPRRLCPVRPFACTRCQEWTTRLHCPVATQERPAVGALSPRTFPSAYTGCQAYTADRGAWGLPSPLIQTQGSPPGYGPSASTPGPGHNAVAGYPAGSPDP